MTFKCDWRGASGIVRFGVPPIWQLRLALAPSQAAAKLAMIDLAQGRMCQDAYRGSCVPYTECNMDRNKSDEDREVRMVLEASAAASNCRSKLQPARPR